MVKSMLVQPISGFSAQVGVLLSMMEMTRETTRARVVGLTVPQLDWRFDSKANSIGMLLGHIAAVEEIYTIEHLEGRKPTAEENSWLQPRLELEDAGFEAMRGTKLNEYFADLERARKRTEEQLSKIDDEALNRPMKMWGMEVNLHW